LAPTDDGKARDDGDAPGLDASVIAVDGLARAETRAGEASRSLLLDESATSS
jgi:hypothetical protein